ncbi:glycosyltransferase [Halobacterium salinarum]|uniref:glycosyltransferase n=1 Tax=Halobacterium salinarum TaxID=2242 RepID=UPI002555F11F|nr:glycosyltransferase [Halobacterium salinarum]MDL0135132.1 glycosyltransferase [Halobacterium salinarum]
MISVIIPVFNDPEGIRDTLQSLIDQSGSPNYEIIVVDNDSTDSTPDVIAEFEEKYPSLVFGYSETDIQSSYAARNTGIDRASGEILAFIDADVTVENMWVANICKKFQSSNVDYLGCNVDIYIPDGEDTIWARYDAAMGLPVEHYLETKQFAPTCALAIRREIIEEVGEFDQTLISGGDKEFGTRVHHKGFSMEYAADIVIQHPARTTLDAHLKKAVRIGEGQVQLWDRYDLATHPFSLLRLLPPSPRRVKARTQSTQTPIRIYFLSYILKLVQSISSMEQYILKRLK